MNINELVFAVIYKEQSFFLTINELRIRQFKCKEVIKQSLMSTKNIYIVLLLLHVSEFTDSMDSPQSRQEVQLVPFEWSYTVQTQQFLTFITKDFFLNTEKSLYLKIISEVNEALKINL